MSKVHQRSGLLYNNDSYSQGLYFWTIFRVFFFNIIGVYLVAKIEINQIKHTGIQQISEPFYQ